MSAGPTAVVGVVPRRVQADAAALRSFSPGSRSVVVAKALRHLQSVILDGVKDRDVVLWGHGLQKAYGELVSRSLSLSGSEVFGRVSAYLNRITAILRSIDLEAVYGTAPPSSLLDRLLNRANGRIETTAAFEAARIEIDQLVDLMGTALESLLSMTAAIERLSDEIDGIGKELEAAALAAEFLSMRLRDERPELSQRYLERAMSLTRTVAQIVEGAPLRKEQIEQPLRLVGTIQNIVIGTVPGWLAAASTLGSTATSSRGPTPTQTGELAHRLAGILQRLDT